METTIQGSVLDRVHHLAISVSNIRESVEWYTARFKCNVSYQDDTWAMLDFANIQMALVTSSQHPPHISFACADAEKFGPLRPHRDGTRSTYITDPDGNSVEILAEPS